MEPIKPNSKPIDYESIGDDRQVDPNSEQSRDITARIRETHRDLERAIDRLDNSVDQLAKTISNNRESRVQRTQERDNRSKECGTTGYSNQDRQAGSQNNWEQREGDRASCDAPMRDRNQEQDRGIEI